MAPFLTTLRNNSGGVFVCVPYLLETHVHYNNACDGLSVIQVRLCYRCFIMLNIMFVIISP